MATPADLGTGSDAAGVGGSILVVDDEPAIRRLFVRTLERSGLPAIEASGGAEALAIIARESVSLILLDSTMPGMDGPAVLERLRADPSMRTLPVIMVTGNAAPAERVIGLGLGADDFIAKPVILDELVARVRSQLRLHAAWQARIDQELRERRAIAAAGRRVQVSSRPEVTAASFVAEMVQALDLAGMAILVFTRAGTVALASSGDFLGQFPPGHLLDRVTGASVRRRVASGGRLDIAGAAGRDDRRRLERCWLPLRGGGQVQGALVVATVPDSSDRETGAAARAIERFSAVADLAVTLLPAAIGGEEGDVGAWARLVNVIGERLFETYVQPIVRLADRVTVGYEALTRFHDGGSPAAHFAEARRVGLGPELELNAALAAFGAAGKLSNGAFLAVNISPSVVVDHAAAIRDSLNGGGRVVLELTELEPVQDYAALQVVLESMGPMTSIAVDDAGSGYSSLEHILRLRPALVKLDIAWVRGIESDPARKAIVAGLVHFASETGCQIIAEGIETEAERAALEALGVGLGQGYLLGRPRPVPSIGRGGHGTHDGGAGPTAATLH